MWKHHGVLKIYPARRTRKCAELVTFLGDLLVKTVLICFYVVRADGFEVQGGEKQTGER